MTPAATTIAAVRRFNRFYTRQIGVLRKNFLDIPFSLGESRVLYEIAHGDARNRERHRPRARSRRRLPEPRVLRNFEKRGLIERKTSAKDARQSHLAPDGARAATFAPLEKRSQQQVGDMLGKLKRDEQSQLVSAMNSIQSLLNGQVGVCRASRSCARLSPAISAGSSPVTPSSTARNTAGPIRSRACARRSSPTSSTSSTPRRNAPGSPN